MSTSDTNALTEGTEEIHSLRSWWLWEDPNMLEICSRLPGIVSNLLLHYISILRTFSYRFSEISYKPIQT